LGVGLTLGILLIIAILVGIILYYYYHRSSIRPFSQSSSNAVPDTPRNSKVMGTQAANPYAVN